LRGKKRLLASLLARSGVLRLARAATGSRSRITVLAYHRVLPDLVDFSGDEELVSALATDFRWQMEFISAACRPITADQLLAAVRGECELPPRAVMVTFDDGCVDSIRYALPVLVDCGVPACFFVASGYVSTPDLYWFDEVVHRFYYCDRPRFRLDTLAMDVRLPPEPRLRKSAALEVLQALKLAGNGRRLEALEEIRKVSGVALPAAVIDANRPMTWEELRILVARGMSIGSHSVTHPVLAELEDRRLCSELEDSKLAIERETSTACHSIAYPLGGGKEYSVSGAIAVDERVRRFAAQAGYEVGFTYIPGIARLQQDDPLLLKRVAVERYLTRDEFAARLSMPDLFL